MKRKLAALAAGMALGASSMAHAAIISLHFDLKASGFDAGAPTDPVMGNFQITFDNAANVFPAQGITVTGFNLPFSGSYAYNATTDTLYVGTDPDPGSAPVFGKGGYGFNVLNASGAYTGGFFQYLIFDPSSTSVGIVHRTSQVTLTPVTTTAGVPEPSAWALLVAAFSLAGVSLRAGRRKSIC